MNDDLHNIKNGRPQLPVPPRNQILAEYYASIWNPTTDVDVRS